MVQRGPGYFDNFVSIPNPMYSARLKSQIVDSRDMDQDLLKRYGYGVARPMPRKFKIFYTNQPGREIIF